MTESLALPPGLRPVAPRQLHLSLYRAFGWGDALAREVPKMKRAVYGLAPGSVAALRVATKRKGDDDSYRDVAVLPRGGGAGTLRSGDASRTMRSWGARRRPVLTSAAEGPGSGAGGGAASPRPVYMSPRRGRHPEPGAAATRGPVSRELP